MLTRQGGWATAVLMLLGLGGPHGRGADSVPGPPSGASQSLPSLHRNLQAGLDHLHEIDENTGVQKHEAPPPESHRGRGLG